MKRTLRSRGWAVVGAIIGATIGAGVVGLLMATQRVEPAPAPDHVSERSAPERTSAPVEPTAAGRGGEVRKVIALRRDACRPADESEGRARVAAFFGAFRSVLDADDLGCAYLEDVDLAGLARAVLVSGVRASDLRRSLEATDPPSVPTDRVGAAYLAMAFAPGFGDEDAGFLAGVLQGSPALFEAPRARAADTTALLAAAQALRLRGRLFEAMGEPLAAALATRWTDRQGQQFSNQTAGLLAMLCESARRDPAPRLDAASAAFAAAILDRQMNSQYRDAETVLALLRHDEAEMLRRIRSGLLGAAGTWIQSALPVLYRDRDQQILRAVLATEDGTVGRARALGAVVGLLANGSAPSTDSAFGYLATARNVPTAEFRLMAKSLPVDVTMRCAAAMSGRCPRGSVAASVRDTMLRTTQRRLRAIALSANQRRGLLGDLRELLARPSMTPLGRQYCIRSMGHVGGPRDRAEIRRLAATYALEDAGREAIEEIESRMRRRSG